MRVAGVLFAVFALAAVLWMTIGGRSAPDGDLPTADPNAEATAAPAPSLAGSGGTRPSAPAPDPVAPAEVPETPSSQRYRVRGHVTGMGKDAAAGMRITVRALGPREFVADEKSAATGGVSSDLRFVVDVTGLFRERPEALAQLEVQVDHPDAVPAKQRIDLVGRREAQTTWEVALHLEKAAVATGLVTDARGVPLQDAAVAAYAMEGGAPAIGMIMPVPPLHETRTDAQGRYRLRVAGSASYVVATAVKARIPASAIVSLERGVVASVDPLVLRKGEVLTGTARYAESLLSGVTVTARPGPGEDGAGGFFSVGDQMLGWRNAQVAIDEVQGKVDAEGRFRLEGLSPGEWRVQALLGKFPGLDAVSWACRQYAGQVVTVPSSEVDLVLAGGLLLVRVLGLDPEAEGAVLRAREGGGSTSCDVKRDGWARLLLTPGAECRLAVSAPGYVSSAQTERVPAEGEERRVEITLVPEAPRPVLVVTLHSEDGLPVKRAHFQVLPKTPAQPNAERQTTEESEDGEYRLERLQPGTSKLRILPWRGYFDESGYGLTIEREIELPVEGEQRLEITARRGGRLRVAARDEAGKLLDAECTVRDAGGTKVPLNFMGQRGNVMMSMPGQLGTLSPALSDPPMEPGAYTLELRYGALRRAVPARVEAGKTLVLDVRLTE